MTATSGSWPAQRRHRRSRPPPRSQPRRWVRARGTPREWERCSTGTAIAERGRSLDVVLFGAEQFMGAVQERVVGNSAMTVSGRTGSSELSAPAYRFLDQSVKANIVRLGKGELVISHATFRQPVKISFPRPAYRQEGIE